MAFNWFCCSQLQARYPFPCVLFFFKFLFLREHEQGRARERGGHQGLNSWTARSWPELKLDTQPTEPPRCPSHFIDFCTSPWVTSLGTRCLAREIQLRVFWLRLPQQRPFPGWEDPECGPLWEIGQCEDMAIVVRLDNQERQPKRPIFWMPTMYLALSWAQEIEMNQIWSSCINFLIFKLRLIIEPNFCVYYED